MKIDIVNLRIRLIYVFVYFSFSASSSKVLELIAPTTLIGQLERIKRLSFTFLNRNCSFIVPGPGYYFS